MLEGEGRDRSEEKRPPLARLDMARDTIHALRSEVDRLRVQLAQAGGEAGLRVRRAEQLVVRWQVTAEKLREKAQTSKVGALLELHAARLDGVAAELTASLHG